MLASVLRLIGLDKAQEAFKLALEEKRTKLSTMSKAWSCGWLW